MAVCWEVDRGEGDWDLSALRRRTMVGALTVTEQTGASSLVQAYETQVSNNPHGGSPGNTLHVLRKLTLNLQANLDDLERICEDLFNTVSMCVQHLVGELLTT